MASRSTLRASTDRSAAGVERPAVQHHEVGRTFVRSAEVHPQGVRILIADDHQIFRAGLRKLLEGEPGFAVVGEARDGAEAVELVERLGPDILLLDLSMPTMPGLATLEKLVASPCRTVLLAAEIDKSQLIEALRLGARGVILKDSATELLFRCVRSVMSGEYWVGRESIGDLVQCLRGRPAADTPPARPMFELTPREIEVTTAVVAGYANKEIGQRLGISEDTVKHHLSSIFDKLGVSSRLEMALFAVHHHLVGH
jgi:two-component system, NarL family, nitrate/nitrite response regulator NarL